MSAQIRKIRKVITEAMHEAYRYDASGPNSEDILDALQNAGYVVVPASVVNGTIKSFRDVEQRGSLYDAATHRWIDLLAEVSA